MSRTSGTTRTATRRTAPVLVLGVDVGGTHTRATIATTDGRVLATGTAQGANRHSSSVRLVDALQHGVADALHALPDGIDASAVGAAVVAIAGLSHAAAVEGEVLAALADTGVEVAATILPDVVANHAAGARTGDGLVLVAGTGAIAGHVVADRLARRADGAGWLLGDGGSAVWLGLEAVRAVLASWDGRGPGTALAQPVVAHALGHDEASSSQPVEALIAAVTDGSPANLGTLAPTVTSVAAEDEVAADIVARGIRLLGRTARAAAGDAVPDHLVLAGAVLTGSPVVREGVLCDLRRTWPHIKAVEGRDGAAGAAAIALRSLNPDRISEEVYDRLLGPR